MPVVTVQPITRPEELVTYFVELFEESTLGLGFVSKYDEELIPKYPAIQVQPGETDKSITGTHTMAVGLRATMYVMHATLTFSKRDRSQADLELATECIKLIEKSMTLGGRVIQGYVERDKPMVLPPRSTKGDAVVSTRIDYVGLQQIRFK